MIDQTSSQIRPLELSDNYSFTGLTYPDDLLREDNTYGNNYVVFYINVHQDSVLIKNNQAGYIDAEQESLRGSITNIDGTALQTTGVVAAATAANVAKRIMGDLTPVGSAVGNTVIGGAIGVAAVKTIGNVKKQYKQQLKAIALYMPSDLMVRYSTQWETADFAGTAALAMVMENATKAAGSISLAGGDIATIVNRVTDAASQLAGGTTSIGKSYVAGGAIQTPGPGQALAKATGTAANPKKEQLFKEVDYRTFTFSYQFFPRDEKEAKAVNDIIHEFKLHMHPEFRPDTHQFLYIYPSEFDIRYYNGGMENDNIHKHTSCVLTDMSVSYAPQANQFSSFADGVPTQININLTFKELALLTRENIIDGF